MKQKTRIHGGIPIYCYFRFYNTIKYFCFSLARLISIKFKKKIKVGIKRIQGIVFLTNDKTE